MQLDGDRNLQVALARLMDDSKLDGASANLHGTFLVAVKLAGADLSTAKGLSQPQINAARGDKDTKLPEEFQRPPRWLNEPQVG